MENPMKKLSTPRRLKITKFTLKETIGVKSGTKTGFYSNSCPGNIFADEPDANLKHNYC
jgi:hypothetical protein